MAVMHSHEQRLQLVVHGVFKGSAKIGKRLSFMAATFGIAIARRHGSGDKRLHVDPGGGNFERDPPRGAVLLHFGLDPPQKPACQRRTQAPNQACRYSSKVIRILAAGLHSGRN